MSNYSLGELESVRGSAGVETKKKMSEQTVKLKLDKKHAAVYCPTFPTIFPRLLKHLHTSCSCINTHIYTL